MLFVALCFEHVVMTWQQQQQPSRHQLCCRRRHHTVWLRLVQDMRQMAAMVWLARFCNMPVPYLTHGLGGQYKI
jgi:hypothetical protein